MENPYRIQHIELEIRSEPQGGRLELEGCRNATCRAREVGVGGRMRRAALQVGWHEGTYRPNLARQLEISNPAMAWTVTMKLPPEKVEEGLGGGEHCALLQAPPSSAEMPNLARI